MVFHYNTMATSTDKRQKLEKCFRYAGYLTSEAGRVASPYKETPIPTIRVSPLGLVLNVKNKDLSSTMSIFGVEPIEDDQTETENIEQSHSDFNNNTNKSLDNTFCQNELEISLTEVTVQSESTDKTLTCCGKRFKHHSSMRRHKIIVHSDRGKKCHLCEKQFYSKADLNDHLTSHDKQKRFKCAKCYKAYKTRGGLNSHNKEHNADYKYVCDICGKGFVYKNSFDGHKAGHTNQKPFECTKCGKKYRHKSSLSRHTCGDKEQNFACDYCGKTFIQYRYLSDHLKAHDNPERFQCSTCGNCYKFRPSFYKHKKKTGH